jgi:hypothetical protein
MGMHFSPSTFKLKSPLLFRMLLLIALYLSIRQRHSLRWVFLLYALDLGAYVLNYYTLRWAPLWYCQLPRATIWLKPLALFLILGSLQARRPLNLMLSPAMAVSLASLSFLILYRLARNDKVGRY